MAHEITARRNGFIEFAFAGPREAIWHKLGQQMQDGASIDQWKVDAGMDWQINSSPLIYQFGEEQRVEENVQILHRSDDGKRLGIVSDSYKIVQPGEVLEFFRDLTELHGMKLSAAGTLFGGSKFWATADVGKSNFVVDGDRVDGYLLLMSSADGTSSTVAKFCATRAVCNNTIQIALTERSKNAIKITHARDFDAKAVKIDMGLIDQAWDGFIENIKKMATKSVDDKAAQEFFAKLITPEDKAVDMELLRTQRHVDAMMHFYKSGAGADMTYGTQWGVLNAVTELATHGQGKRDASKQFVDSEIGGMANMKMEAYKRLVAMI